MLNLAGMLPHHYGANNVQEKRKSRANCKSDANSRALEYTKSRWQAVNFLAPESVVQRAVLYKTTEAIVQQTSDIQCHRSH